MPHYPIVVQQEAEVMLPRKPNMWQYIKLKVTVCWSVQFYLIIYLFVEIRLGYHLELLM
jgi:hypothetical protein